MKLLNLLLAISLAVAPWAAVPAALAVPGSVFTVTNSTDSGVGSLRDAIDQANASPGPDTIVFASWLKGSTILPSTSLPPLIDSGTVIDASAVWNGSWPTGKPGITIDGGAASITPTVGLMVLAAQNVVIKGLAVQGFDTGIYVGFGAQRTVIGSGGSGGRMVIRANRGDAVIFEAAYESKLVGSYIGTSFAGNLREPNGGSGVVIRNGERNWIGGYGGLEGNLIGSSGLHGVLIEGSGAISNVVVANSIGIGMLNGSIANAQDDIRIADGASYNGIGGEIVRVSSGANYSPTVGNALVGSGGNGVTLVGTATGWNGIMGSSIDHSGVYGIYVDGAANTVIGGTSVTRSGWSGIMLANGASRNWIVASFAGTDQWGNGGLGAGHHAIAMYNGASDNTVSYNVAVASGWTGIAIVNSSTTGNWVVDNAIGIGPQSQMMGNAYYGVSIVESPGNALTLNRIAYNGPLGLAAVNMSEATAIGNGLFRNLIYDNTGVPVALNNLANHGLSAPQITAPGCRAVSGTGAGPYGRVEVFSGPWGDATRFEGFTYADAAGNWTLANVWTRGEALMATRSMTTTLPVIAPASPLPAGDMVIHLSDGEQSLSKLRASPLATMKLETSPYSAPVYGGCALNFLPLIRR